MTDEQRRLTYLRENVEQLEDEKASLERLLFYLQTTDEVSAVDILKQLRSGQNIYTVAQEVVRNRNARYSIEERYAAERGREGKL